MATQINFRRGHALVPHSYVLVFRAIECEETKLEDLTGGHKSLVLKERLRLSNLVNWIAVEYVKEQVENEQTKRKFHEKRRRKDHPVVLL